MNIIKFAIIITLLSVSNIAQSNTDSFSFGVVPQQSAQELAKRWTPVFEYINSQHGIKLRFQTAKNIPAFEQQLLEGTYDFAYMNPYHFTVFNEQAGYQAILVRRDQPINGIVVVHKDSDINSLSELAGQRLAFPSPAAFAASMLPRAAMRAQGIAFSPVYVSSHDSVYLNVVKGIFPAGGGVKRTFNNLPADIRQQLKILWVTPDFTPHAFAASKTVDSEAIEKVQNAFLAMSSSPEGLAILRKLKMKNGLRAAMDDDWNDVRASGLSQIKTAIE